MTQVNLEDAVLAAVRRHRSPMTSGELLAALPDSQRCDVLEAVWCLAEDYRLDFTPGRKIKVARK